MKGRWFWEEFWRHYFHSISRSVIVDREWPKSDYDTHWYSKNRELRQKGSLNMHPSHISPRSHEDKSWNLIHAPMEISCNVRYHTLYWCSFKGRKFCHRGDPLCRGCLAIGRNCTSLRNIYIRIILFILSLIIMTDHCRHYLALKPWKKIFLEFWLLKGYNMFFWLFFRLLSR